MSLTKYSSNDTLPAYSPASVPISPVEEKAALASHIAALPHELDPAAVCAAYGHDARPGIKTVMALAATFPFSVAYVLTHRTVACNRCGERVRRSCCCPMQAARSGSSLKKTVSAGCSSSAHSSA